MQEGKPVFKKENLMYEREEKEGFYTIIPKYHPETKELVINRTARELLELCDGRRTLEEIEKEMLFRYPEIPSAKIKADVLSVISKFSRLLVIEWIGENPFLYKKEEILSDDLSLVVGQEEDIFKILKFIDGSNIFQEIKYSEDYFYYKDPLLNELEYVEEVALRAKLFSYAEEFFLLRKNSEIIGLISIGVPIMPRVTAAVIKLIIAPKEYFVDFIKYAQDSFPLLTVKRITKIKIFETSSKKMQSELKKEFENLGYKEEGTLEHELGYGLHLTSFSWVYPQTFIERVEQYKESL